ncbi:hypothetical protein [Actinacidiphila glaucinigra]|uniref:SLAC1 family transporter n=1 Tax=Actinacidiphila glaucinigra TaxID=235986 RepID=UPI002E341F71|nr:hypothetical protein [Actinacidiphila glaucinigra]
MQSAALDAPVIVTPADAPPDAPTDASSRPAHAAAGNGGGPRRATRIGLMSVSLGTAGLGGLWQSAAATVDAPLGVSDVLFVVSALVWVVLLAQYLRHGGTRWRNVVDDLHHPGQGFALAYVPIVGMLATGHFARFGVDGARWSYALFALASAVIAARLLAHWVSGGLGVAPLHPGYLLPVVSGPFIASTTATAVRLPDAAAAAFAVGVLYWLAFGTVVLGRLVAGGLPGPARPTLTVLTIPPAVGGLAWTAAHGGRVDSVGQGFAGLVLFTVLIVLFLVPHVRQDGFHLGYWVFSFPAAATGNFLVRWLHGAGVPGGQGLTWLVVALVSGAFLVLYAATGRYAVRAAGRHRAVAAEG